MNKSKPGSLERAISLAADAHAGQTDKAGAPYILHPLRVMLKQTTDEARIVAVLHDVVEDGPGWSFDRLLEEGFSEAVIEGVRAVTKRPEEGKDDPSYIAFVRRAASHPIGRMVKLADLEDNCDLSRIDHPTDLDHARLAKYRRAILEIASTPLK